MVGDAVSHHSAEVLAASAVAKIGNAELLQRDLKPGTVVEALAVIRAIQVGIEITGERVDARVRCGLIVLPRAHVDAQSVGTARERNFLERPERNGMQIRCNAVARLQVVALDAVEEYAHATEVATEGGCLRCREPAGAEGGESRDAIQQVTECERTRREERVTIVRERLPDLERRHDVVPPEARLHAIGVLRLGWRILRRVAHGIAWKPLCVGARGGNSGHRRDARRCNQRAPREANRHQRAQRARRNSTNVPTGTPVGPLGMKPRSVSEYAVPATSRCTQGYSSANSCRNAAAVIAPPGRPPEFLMSATSDLMRSV